ncbi:YbaN family protein [Terasakiella sp.]|uniref:YbaN family protein n=1 Tax=Terasakiella sp. TaxID=2034861 RepID=UPI003AA822ED
MSTNSQRHIFLAIGWVFTGLGFVGVILPLLPTTPFLLVAVWAFSKSSPKLRRWLFTHPRFGHHLRNWFDQRAISRQAKIVSVSFMALSVGFSLLISENLYVIVSLAVIMVATATFILTRPTPSAVAIKSQ